MIYSEDSWDLACSSDELPGLSRRIERVGSEFESVHGDEDNFVLLRHQIPYLRNSSRCVVPSSVASYPKLELVMKKKNFLPVTTSIFLEAKLNPNLQASFSRYHEVELHFAPLIAIPVEQILAERR